MAVELALSAVGPVIEIVKFVGKPILRQCNYLCCFSSNISGLEEEAKKLDDAFEGLQRQVRTESDNNKDPSPAVETWLTNSNKMKDEISGILSEASNVGSGCWSKLGACCLSRRAKKTTESVEKLIVEKPSAEFLEKPNAATQEVELGKTFECESRNKIEEEIMTTLKDVKKNMIGICGMGGLGKTTMATKIMNSALKKGVFQEAVIVTFSQNVDISGIQKKLGGQLGLKRLKEENLDQNKSKLELLSRLRDTKRTLLVLDDVWGTPPLESIGIPGDSEWCTVLFTSRNRDVLRAMDGVQIFRMDTLSEDEAWSFFKEKVGSCAEDKELKDIPKQIVKECGGMPINLAAVGAVLKDQGKVGIWKGMLKKLKKNVPRNVRYDRLQQTYNPLKLSYEFLKSEDHSKAAASVFLLCCLFPEDADIPLDYLTHFSMGLGGIFDEDDITNMEDAGYSMCEMTELLKDRSLILESDEKDCVRMHDVVRDVCKWIAEEEGYIGKDGGRWISSSHLVGESNELLSVSRCPNFNLLFLNRRYDSSSGFQFDDAFVEGMKELNVLCIEGYSLTALPNPRQSLGNLKTLILVECEKLETISGVGELVNLEILSCRNCTSIEELPSEMKGLNRLKVLELTGCESLQSIGRGIIASLVALEELKMQESFNRWEAEEREERENASIKELEALPNLTCLEIEIDDHSVLTENMPLLSKKIVRFKIKTDFPPYFSTRFSKAVSLYLGRESRLGAWIETQFLRDTEYLYLGGQGANNVDLGKCQNIRWLILRKCKSVKNVVRTSGGSDNATVFPLIEYLELESLPELQEICDGPISSTSFQNLKELQLKSLEALTQFWKSSSVCQNNNVPHFSNLSSIDIVGCDKLCNLGQLSMAGKDCLPQLEKLIIVSCQMMEQVFLLNDEEEAGKNKVFPELKWVVLEDLRNLTTFIQGIRGIKFPLLQKLRIKGCPKWKSIIDGSNSADFDEDGSSHLLCQPQKVSFGSSLEVLHINHNPFRGHEIPSSLFNGLEELTISQYEGSMSLFTLPMAANLGSLRVLRISKCDEMTNVIEDEQQQERILVFPKLEELELTELPKLVSFCNSKCEVELPSLRKVYIRKCPNMENFSLGLVATPKLEAFKTDLTTYVGVGVDVIAFHSLKTLEIKENENPLNDDKISVSLFNGLEKLIFSFCQGSMSLFSSSIVQNLVNLRVLKIGQCDQIVKVIEDEEEEDDEKVVLSGGEIKSTVVFPKLEELTLKSLRKLVSFCEWKCDLELPLLTRLVIYECPNMENFSMGCVSAPNLEIVYVDNDYHKKIGGTKDLNGLLQQHYLKAFQFNHNPFCGHEIPSSTYNLLEKLTISKYEGSMSLFTLSMVAIPVNLRILCIQNCDEMINVIEDEQQQERILVFSNLKELYLKNLPKLVSFCVSKCEVEFPSLRKVEIEKCPNMENFSMGLVATPNLEDFTTDLSTYVGLGVGVDAAFTSLKRLEITAENEIPFDLHKISVSLFNGLEKLEFSNSGSTSLFLTSAIGNLVNLRVIQIKDCYSIVKVIKDEEEEDDGKVVLSGGEIWSTVVFPKLEVLTLYKLPKLESFCEWKRDVELPSLRRVNIRECPNMKSFSMGLVAAPNLKIVEINYHIIEATKDLNVAVQQHYLARQEKGNFHEGKSTNR